MLKTKHFFCFTAVLFAGCYIDKPCKSSRGCPDSYESVFRIVSKINGNDLLFGPTGLYDASKIKVFSLTGGDTMFANVESFRLQLNGYDSVLHFKLSNKPDSLFIQLNNNDIDTITVSYGPTEGRCCSFNSIRTLTYNNSLPLANYNGTVDFEK
ncbi:MAG: hypothetical protein M3R50_06285 [Bacteroidota bacterium]|nr:hypothetical protein [Bacteroidota bacterium]